MAKHGHRGRRGGRSIDVEETLALTIENGQITRLDSSFEPEDQSKVDEFWA